MTEPQMAVSVAISARGYYAGWTDEQLVARHLVKLQEELSEAFNHASDMSPNAAGQFGILRDEARWLEGPAKAVFDDRAAWGHIVVSADDARQLRAELADVQVVVLSLASLLERLTGEPFDVVAAAVTKATADVSRGVRQSATEES